MTSERIWTYAPETGHTEGRALTGYTVVATDGTVGRVEREAGPQGMRHLVVETGMWVFGRSAVVPAGTVAGIDDTGRRVLLTCTRDEVKAAPRFRTDSETRDPRYLATVGAYYLTLTPRGAAPA
ncbi:PRC-barrel domain containing protein [Streptomyces roseirectus]|uniref:PRC-barrel domain containing protein n=1 Tax=Streptomyces roseirectus TaxID=2768066 RepID=A0A7H0I6N4_9ACTN|nr:PRC-barrel domain containing protein [Streptomyces roseirectus]QNP68450.1 PRC-barrel domain containing protein [Streptomyces roseirectus]